MLREIEALLFATDQPLTAEKLAGLIENADRKQVKEAVEELRAEYDRDGRAFTIVEFGGGYSISARPEYATLIKRLFRSRRKQRLSRAALEALAIIAYKQPVTRLEIEEIRGVSASGVLGTLLERDLVQIVGRAETLGHPLLYGTTKTLLDYLGLKSVRELPALSELEDLLAEKEELKQLAAQRGDALDEEDFERVLSPEDGETPDEVQGAVQDEAPAEADDAVQEEAPAEADDAVQEEVSAENDDEELAGQAVAGGDDEVERDA